MNRLNILGAFIDAMESDDSFDVSNAIAHTESIMDDFEIGCSGDDCVYVSYWKYPETH